MNCTHEICNLLSDTCQLPATTTPAAGAARLLAGLTPAAVRAELYRRSFRAFLEAAWPVIEPTRALMPSVAIDALCAVLQEAAERGGRWAIACPPGVSKSIVCSIAWPAWLLLRSGGTARVMAGSYAWDLASRDSLRCKDLLESPWYRALVAGAWTIRTDADRRDDFWTSAGGRRLVTATGAKATGERARFQILDDVLSATDALSAAKRKEAARWVSTVMPSRLEDPENDCRVIIGQRLHVEDPIGVVLEQGGWHFLRLPALADDDGCELRRADGSLIWRDPRAPGDPLVALLGPDALARLKIELGSAAYAAQYLARPTDDTAAVIKRAWWRFYRAPHVAAGAPRPAGCDDAPAVEMPKAFERLTIACDLTFGALGGDYAVVQAWGSVGGARYLLAQWRKQAGFEESSAAIVAMARQFPTAKVVIEKAANGAAVIETLRKSIPGVVPVVPIGAKAQRLAAIAPTVESGACFLPLGAAWLGDFVEELAGASKHDDAADAAAYAIHDLNIGDDDPGREAFRRLLGYAPLQPGETRAELIERELRQRDRRRAGLPAEDVPASDDPDDTSAPPLPTTAEGWAAFAARLSSIRN